MLERQLREIGRYVVAPICRHRLLTEHFGQPYPAPAQGDAIVNSSSVEDNCGACDICLGETKELAADLALLTAQKIISAAWRLEGRFGPGQCVDVLLGRRTDKSERAGHDRLKVFGMLQDVSEATVRAWLDQLIVQGFLALREDGVYSFLLHTEAGKALCRGEGSVRLGQIADRPTPARAERKPKSSSSSKSSVTTDDAPLSSQDQALFERLRTMRKQVASAAGVPPYVVFHDSTLQAIASARPKTIAAMTAIKGIGERKAARYGAAVLAVVQNES